MGRDSFKFFKFVGDTTTNIKGNIVKFMKRLDEICAECGRLGSEVTVSTELPLRAKALGTTDITSLELIGKDGVIAQTDGDGVLAELQTTAYSPYVYARVTQQDGEMAWASPIFMSR